MYNRLARRHPQATFIDIPITNDNANLREELKIIAVPTGHIYHPGAGLVEELKMAKSYWNDFEDVFYSYMNGHCDVGGFDYRDPMGRDDGVRF